MKGSRLVTQNNNEDTEWARQAWSGRSVCNETEAEAGADLSAQKTDLESGTLPKMTLCNVGHKDGSVRAPIGNGDNSLFDVSEATASQAEHDDEIIGKLIYFVAGDDDMTVTHTVVDAEVTLPEAQHILPISQITRIGNKETCARLKITRKKSKKAPSWKHSTLWIGTSPIKSLPIAD